MNSRLRIRLNPTADQAQRLRDLQKAFADVCNALAPVVREHRCWNRVTLHHLTYHKLREAFPALGSQMVCNAIYAVCRAARGVFQSPQSPFHLSRLKGDRLPLLNFAPSCPVFFDRHTLSLKDGQLSMYTLDGRMRFQLYLDPQAEARFRSERLREILLSQAGEDKFELVFVFADEQDEDAGVPVQPSGVGSGIPPYVRVEQAAT